MSALGMIVAGLDFLVSKLKGELAEERAARKTAEARAAEDRAAFEQMRAWGAAQELRGEPVRAISLETFRRRQDEAAAKGNPYFNWRKPRNPYEHQREPTMVDPANAQEMQRAMRGNYGGPPADAPSSENPMRSDNPGRAIVSHWLKRPGNND